MQQYYNTIIMHTPLCDDVIVFPLSGIAKEESINPRPYDIYINNYIYYSQIYMITNKTKYN